MYAEIHEVELTTDADGDAVGYTPNLTGEIRQIRYVKADGAAAYAAGVEVAVSLEKSGTTVWAEDDVDASATRCPRQPSHTTAGVAAEYADGFAQLTPIVVANERVKIVVADGGDTKSGTFFVTVA